MRSFLSAFAIASLVAASVFAASAFTYADLEPRTVVATIVTDQNGYLAVWEHDADFACYVGGDEVANNGKIEINWDGGTSCAGGGTGVNPDSTYYYHDVLVLTNKGNKALTNVWLNMSTDDLISITIASAPDTMFTTDTYAQTKVISNLAVGASYYIGFKINAVGKDTSDASISRTLSIEARHEG